MPDQTEHSLRVDAWLERSAKKLSTEALLRLFEHAFAALWARTATTLGEVTLAAIADRVLYNAAEQFPLFASVTVDPSGGIQCRELRARIGAVRPAELKDATRFVLVEFLSVLGNLTAGILTRELHAELATIELPVAKAEVTGS
jgi:hypothetical protein